MKLPDFLIADLYKDTLVEIPLTKIDFISSMSGRNIDPEKKSQNDPLRYLGENGKQICIIVDSKEAVFVEEADLTFLISVLKACELNLADVAIVNIANTPANYTYVKETLGTRYFILFGTLPSTISLPFSVPHFQLQNYADCIFMTAPSLSTINQTTEEVKTLKKNLWGSLLNMFSISK